MHYLIEIITEKAIIVNKYCSTNHMAQATIWMWKRKEMRTQRKKKEKKRKVSGYLLYDRIIFIQRINPQLFNSVYHPPHQGKGGLSHQFLLLVKLSRSFKIRQINKKIGNINKCLKNISLEIIFRNILWIFFMKVVLKTFLR